MMEVRCPSCGSYSITWLSFFRIWTSTMPPQKQAPMDKLKHKEENGKRTINLARRHPHIDRRHSGHRRYYNMSSKIYILGLVGFCIMTGCMNSLFTKYQDNQCVRNCSDPDTSKHQLFEQPALQTLQMFIGEFSCILVYYLVYRSKFSGNGDADGYDPLDDGDTDDLSLFHSFKLAIPSICDLCATTLMNVGLVYTPVSIYQMTRGSIVLFVAILSVLFLNRKITKLEWVSLVFVFLGVVIVGLSGSSIPAETQDFSSTSKKDASGFVLFGISLIVLAELFQACQFVIEEHILSKNSIVPLKLVYFEGFYGAVLILLAMIILNFVIGSFESHKEFIHSPFNISESFSQMFGSNTILMSSVFIMLSIAGFNFCGISLTHELSATARSTIDTCRTLSVWLIAILLGWESFHFLQFLGFVVLVFGTLCFNGALKPEEWEFVPSYLKTPGSHERLIDVIDEPIERM